MIAYIEGKIAEKQPTHTVIDCNGVGYFIKISLHTYTNIQGLEKVKLHTYYQVREDAHVLYGFFDLKEKALFEHLISVSGVGGNTALTMLSATSPRELANIIRTQNVLQLKKVKGIGQKTAERLIVELKDKILPDADDVEATEKATLSGLDASKQSQALAALMSLGFAKNVVEPRVNQLLKESNNEISLQDLIKQAMRG